MSVLRAAMSVSIPVTTTLAPTPAAVGLDTDLMITALLVMVHIVKRVYSFST